MVTIIILYKIVSVVCDGSKCRTLQKIPQQRFPAFKLELLEYLRNVFENFKIRREEYFERELWVKYMRDNPQINF